MAKLPCVSGARVVKALERLGSVKRRQRGSYVVLRRGSSVCVVPRHREVDQGMLGGVLRQAGVSVEELVENL